MQYDAIIIGSGLAGLSAGAKLSKEGMRVLLVEQHNRVGGCATTFKRKDFTFEVGLHELNGLGKNEHLYKVYQDLEVSDNLTFLKIPEFYRLIIADMDLNIPDDTNQYRDILIKNFPHEEMGIRKYVESINQIRDNVFQLPQNKIIKNLLTPFFPILFPKMIFNMKKSVGEFLDSIIQDDKLNLVLLGNLLYYHDDPYTMSLIYWSVAQSSFLAGANFVQGGSQKLSDHLAGIITSNGSEVLTRHLATKILFENQKAVGIEFGRNTKKDSAVKKAYAKYIIANSALSNVANDLLPEEKSIKLKKKIDSLKISPSLLNVYMGFNSTLEKFGVKHYSTIVMDKSCTSPIDMYQNFRGDFNKRYFIFVDYGQVDSKLAPKGKSVGSICTSDYLEDWENLSDDDYTSKKEQVAEILIERLNKVYPGIKGAIECYEVGTAKTIKRYTMNPGGSVYGFAQIPRQAGNKRLSQESSFENLYFASAWTEPGGGFGATLGSGYMVANKILKKSRRQ